MTPLLTSKDYPNLAFKEGGFLEHNILQAFDIIFSNCALQHCSNQSLAFDGMAKLLKSNGKLWIVIPAMDNSAWKQARKVVQSSSKWIEYWQNISPRKFLSIEEYEDLLNESGFNLIDIKKIPTLDPFVNREEFLSFLLGTFTPAVPSDKAKEFYNDLIDEYERLLPDAFKENGIIEARFGRLEIVARRV